MNTCISYLLSAEMKTSHIMILNKDTKVKQPYWPMHRVIMLYNTKSLLILMEVYQSAVSLRHLVLIVPGGSVGTRD